ncbi:GIY-YIG nuclease family protein [Methylocaldum sp. RMAD-M]|jgi:hypothetical protein|uniref:GIY-YIG nuclease family protein n=1 Tax=Methylocaldum sp. RMAD-M TaxID=2806557 RepID=UPI001AE9387B|nr:GIY-YIG nuclease family protein [Methylocaldum sp. RMAD-M]MBP1152542.1 hypothetical protein [Methylocaldum sp. RMAD-M]
MTDSVIWTSPSGETFTFGIYNYKGVWNNVAGIYMFCRKNQPQNSWVPLYIGQTDSFQARLSNHEQWLAAFLKGANAVLAAVITRKDSRDRIERDLIQQFQPPLNQQLKTSSLKDFFPYTHRTSYR